MSKIITQGNTTKAWAKYEEAYAKEGHSEEECKEFRRIMVNLDQEEFYNNQKHRRNRVSLDAYTDNENNNVRSAFEFNLDDPLVNYYCKDPETLCIEQEMREEMLSILDELRRNYREVLIFTYYYGLNFSEYGRLKGKSPQWAQQLHNRAIKSLKKLLEEKYMDFVSEVY